MTTTPVPSADDAVRMPAGAKAAIARADELHKQMYPDSTVVDVAPSAEDIITVEPTVTTEVTEPPLTQTPPAPAAPPAEPDEQTWKHKYDSMRGRAEASLKQILARDAKIEELQAALAAKDAAPPQYPAAERLLTEEEERDYGADLLGVVGKRARQELTPEFSQMKAEIADLKKVIATGQQTQLQSAQQKLYTDLDSGLSNWRDINRNDDFLLWLALPDSYSGVTRQELLTAAFEQKNAPRVLAFFNGFLSEEAAVAPAPSGLPFEPAPPSAPKVDLAELAAPGRAKTTAAGSAPVEKPVITGAQITKFYADVASGKYRGKEAEKDRIEKMLFPR